jgi:dephospho-CoA kinase
MARVCTVGLTGGIGSGKSTVAQMLAELGAALIDADALARGVTLAGGAAIRAVAAQFGAQFIDDAGAMDRARMRDEVFANAASRARLEAIIHPLVHEQTEQLAAQAVADGCRCIVFDVPLLVESTSWRRRVDRVLVVDCLGETQVLRVMARSALPREAVEKIMMSQASRLQRLRAADTVVFNDGLTIAQLRSEVAQTSANFGL